MLASAGGALASGFEPRLDVVSAAWRWYTNKRRWHVAQIKTRADVSCSRRKLFKQKGTGGARHSTRAVCQFRGGGKFCARRTLLTPKLNKRVKTLALRSALALKLAAGELKFVEGLAAAKLTPSSFLVHACPRSAAVVGLRAAGVANAHWSKLCARSLLATSAVIVTKRAFLALAQKLKPRWAAKPSQ
ncbi:putative 50S ribosomal subunit protein L4 [Candidatus Hodgkinia cicadicola Dsem]|nr:putative 50S ribosomal subunit protein L4 [Candidatus Hodgkinia cicadicola Dsem]